MKRRPLQIRARLLKENTYAESRLFFEQVRHFEQIWPEAFSEGTAHSKELADRKEAIVYKGLTSLVNKFPQNLDDSFPKGCFRLLALTSDEFFEERAVRHLGRLISSHYFIYKELVRSLRLFPEERHLSFRLMPVQLQFPFGTKCALGIAIGISSLSEYELFNEKHILTSIQQLIPSLSAVQGSFYVNQRPQDPIRLLYIEVEKNSGGRFSVDEIRELKILLSNTLKTRVERLLPLLFMTRNEEEVLKTILILAQELRHRHSKPQVMISFESQSQTELFFTVIIVHLVKTLEQSFRKITLDTDACTWTVNRIQVVEHLEDKGSKEAVVFHVKMKKDEYLLRGDFSINFYLARQRIVKTLQEVLGSIRDYNGGLIVQQEERLAEVKREFIKETTSFPELMENFFYSLEPIEVQATLEHNQLKKIFSLCLEAIKTPLVQQESYFFKAEIKDNLTFVTLRIRDSIMKESLLTTMTAFGTENPLISTSFTFQDHYIFGYIHTSSSNYSGEQFVFFIKQAIEKALEKISNLQTLRLAFPSYPVSLDPRIGGEIYSAMILKMLFEGLMRYGDDGELTYGACRSVTISADAKQYTFKLRESFWSNGTVVTAHDFAYAWKKILSPSFYTPYAYLFYPIKYAKLAKEGLKSLNQVGIYVLDDYTLHIELENPTPYFLQLTALSIYSPVPHLLDTVHPNWAYQVRSKYVCNGPFQLEKQSRTEGILELVKNPFYWNLSPTQPHRTVIIQSNTHNALQMFKNNEIDWLGSPLQDWSSELFKDYEGQIESVISSFTFWIQFNTKRFPFHNVKLRQAFSYAINRNDLSKRFAHSGLPAFSPLSPIHSQNLNISLPDGSEPKALALFYEAIEELGIEKTSFPRLFLTSGTHDVFLNNLMQFIATRWEHLFNIECKVEITDWSTAFDKMAQGDFQLGYNRWAPWVDDPIYTLNAFRNGDDLINFSNWENNLFQRFLSIADQTTDIQERRKYLAKAEEILIHEVPVLPLLYEVRQFIKNDHMHVPICKNIGMFNFRSTSINKQS